MKCHFVVKRIDESNDIQNQMKMHIDTRKTMKKKFDREVDLLLFKGHYMLCRGIPVSTFYIKNKESLDKDYSYIEQKDRQMIRGINIKGYPIYKKGDTHPMKILRLLFELNLFREINAYEYDLLKTCEFNNKLNDYNDLESVLVKPLKAITLMNNSSIIFKTTPLLTFITLNTMCASSLIHLDGKLI